LLRAAEPEPCLLEFAERIGTPVAILRTAQIAQSSSMTSKALLQGLHRRASSFKRMQRVCRVPAVKPTVEQGNFVKPTDFASVTLDTKISREEIFGAVLSMLTCKTEAEAVRMADDSECGLMACASSSDAGRAHDVARQLQA
jgi:acyl-CoA reductase-like NAD-dependent aldehyde dehydrogenase